MQIHTLAQHTIHPSSGCCIAEYLGFEQSVHLLHEARRRSAINGAAWRGKSWGTSWPMSLIDTWSSMHVKFCV